MNEQMRGRVGLVKRLFSFSASAVEYVRFCLGKSKAVGTLAWSLYLLYYQGFYISHNRHRRQRLLRQAGLFHRARLSSRYY